ncbi:SAM-dependent methyltransferase [Desulfosalsimonas propionicica]|uniref:SAM-dependent methyltransferase n=1 Tax=Desulfosalsimonas propionicica TaxID=332175 RepID=A0A7W0HJI0_9BACT|nr:class I SAM-dependent methyltransferase [Desulfosalsimonas propionicica]MBA2880205.1 SAM-dependent methyltransferase [Desulfosalsimonas propionicica]
MNLSLSKQPMTLPDYYTTHCREYHEKTFHIDPSPFLLPFAENLQPGAHVLDIGCGSGRDLLWLTKKGLQATGFESSNGLAALARQNSGCKVIIGDFETYDFSTLQADALLLSGALVHLPQNRLEPVFKNILQSLRARTEATVYLSLKQGQGSFTDQQNRTFYLWQDKDIRQVFKNTGLKAIHFSRTPSLLGTGEAWLGYVLKKEAVK